MEYQSRLRLLGLPLVHLTTGHMENGRYRRGIARGWVAIGDIAFGGLLAVGGVAVGGISLGGLALGGLALAGLSVGIVAVGGLAERRSGGPRQPAGWRWPGSSRSGVRPWALMPTTRRHASSFSSRPCGSHWRCCSSRAGRRSSSSFRSSSASGQHGRTRQGRVIEPRDLVR